MEIFSWLPQGRRAYVTFDLFEDLNKSDSGLPGIPSAPSRADAPERRLRADEPRTVKGLTRIFALLGVIFVAGSAAVWATASAVQTPSATVKLPPARVIFHTSAAPVAARTVAATTARTGHLEGTAGRAEQLSFEPARVISDAAVALPDSKDSKESRYTSLEPAACTIVRNADLSLRRCPGIAGYALETGDARPADYFAIIGPGGERSELKFSHIAPGGSLGKLAEWRAQGNGEPRTLIVRVSLPGKRTVSSLIVAKLDATACVVAVIPRGPRQNEKARSVADREQLNCRSG